jgi:hypothetical protein
VCWWCVVKAPTVRVQTSGTHLLHSKVMEARFWMQRTPLNQLATLQPQQLSI